MSAAPQLGQEISTECDSDGIYTVAASDGTNGAMVISNISGGETELTISGVDLSRAKYYVIDQPRLLSWSPAVNRIANNQVILIVW